MNIFSQRARREKNGLLIVCYGFFVICCETFGFVVQGFSYKLYQIEEIPFFYLRFSASSQLKLFIKAY